MRAAFGWAFVVVAVALAVLAIAEGSDRDLDVAVTGPSGEVGPAESPTPTPTPTATPEPTATAGPDGATPSPSPTATDPADPGTPNTVVEVLGQYPELSQLVDLLGRTDLGDLLTGTGPVTLFAPTDAAWDALSPDLRSDLGTDDELVRLLIGYHLSEDLVTGAELAEATEVETLDGATVRPDDIEPITLDIDGGNGVVHLIGEVLLPEGIEFQVELNTLVRVDPILFASGSADLLPESLVTLDAVAALLVAQPDLTVEVQGHTDSTGEEGGNLVLSQVRAEAVVQYLVSAGVGADRLTAVGYGEEQLLVDPEVSDADKDANRRIEFSIREA